jgi:hypothetical protein
MKSPRKKASTPISRGMALAWLAGCAITLHAPHAAADTVCVSTNAQLRDALATAQHRAMRIEIVQGAYDLADTVWSDSSRVVFTHGGSEILGGYTAGCAGRDIDVDNTVFTDSGGVGGLDGFTPTGDVTLEGLTFRNGNTFSISADQRDADVPPGTRILLRRDAFLDSPGGSLEVYWYQDDDVTGTIRIVDTLVAGNSELPFCAMEVTNYGSTRVEIVNDTVVDNRGNGERGAGFCIADDEPEIDEAALFVYNSIFYGNSGFDLWADTVVSSLVDNTFAEHHAPGAFEIGTLTSDPHLGADYRPIESPPSPVINSGSTSAPGGLPATDLPGRNRVIGTAPDRGAFESSIDDAFLQSVTNTNDSGAGSLRSALTGAIQHGSGIISFDIGSGCGPHVITLQSELPLITVPLIINGYTQTGASANDLDVGSDAVFCVVLESGNSAVTHGLHVPEAAGNGTQVTVNGLAFSGFSDSAVTLNGGAQHIVVGNRFGGNASGHALVPNGIGVRLGTETSGVQIGGDDVAQRNVIGSATNSGIAMFGAASGSPPAPSGTHDNQIVNNLIGVGWSLSESAFTHLGNGARGIYVSGHDNTITGNWIGDNVGSGILLDGGGAQNNAIEANYIGFPWGAGSYGNGEAGIHLQGDVDDAPTGNTMLYNVIAENGAQGVHVGIGHHNRIRRSGIYANGALGIDLASAGVLGNDDDGGAQTTDFANYGINYPVLAGASGNTAAGTFTGTLTTLPGDYRIDFYQTPSGCDPGDNREGLGWIGSTSVTVPVPSSGDQGTASFSVQKSAGDLGVLYANAGITSTTTDGDGDTSEFSACVTYTIADRIFADGFDGP